VVLEAPLALETAAGQLVTMRTPMGEQADLDWAVGFLASEGVISGTHDIASMQWIGSDPTIDPMPPIADTVRVTLASTVDASHKAILSRSHEIRASCGICGVESPAALVASLGRVPRPRPGPKPSLIHHAVAAMRSHQPLFHATGACHGAAIFTSDGTPVAVAEDIGRHNALDRVIGQSLRVNSGPGTPASSRRNPEAAENPQAIDLRDALLVLSGRAGYELIVKAIRVGIPAIVCVGAASSFAIELARAADVRLVGFARPDGTPRVYT
jgi:FdhD protein